MAVDFNKRHTARLPPTQPLIQSRPQVAIVDLMILNSILIILLTEIANEY